MDNAVTDEGAIYSPIVTLVVALNIGDFATSFLDDDFGCWLG